MGARAAEPHRAPGEFAGEDFMILRVALHLDYAAVLVVCAKRAAVVQRSTGR